MKDILNQEKKKVEWRIMSRALALGVPNAKFLAFGTPNTKIFASWDVPNHNFF